MREKEECKQAPLGELSAHLGCSVDLGLLLDKQPNYILLAVLRGLTSQLKSRFPVLPQSRSEGVSGGREREDIGRVGPWRHPIYC